MTLAKTCPCSIFYAAIGIAVLDSLLPEGHMLQGHSAVTAQNSLDHDRRLGNKFHGGLIILDMARTMDPWHTGVITGFLCLDLGYHGMVRNEIHIYTHIELILSHM